MHSKRPSQQKQQKYGAEANKNFDDINGIVSKFCATSREQSNQSACQLKCFVILDCIIIVCCLSMGLLHLNQLRGMYEQMPTVNLDCKEDVECHLMHSLGQRWLLNLLIFYLVLLIIQFT